MKWRSSYLTELQKSMRPGAKAELVTARKMFGNRKSIGLGTIASYRMDPKQRMQRIHYAMACAKWGTLSSGDKAAYVTWAEDNAVTVFSSFLHSYLSELKEDLVLYLPMEKITGTTVKDYSKYANDGTETDVTVTSDGFIDNAMDFNGTSSNIKNSDTVDPTEYTTSAWVKPAGIASTVILLRTNTDTPPVADYSHALKITSGNKFESYLFAGGMRLTTGTTTVVAGLWYHVVATAKNNGHLKLYVNGKSEGTPAGITTMWTDGDRWNVGISTTDPLDYFYGTMDEVRIYKKELTAEEIRSMYIQESKWHGDVA